MKLVSVHTHLLLLFMFTLFGQVSVAQESWTLQQCIDTALVHNRTLQMERNNRSIAEEQYREAKANLIPKLQAQAEYRYFMELPYQLMPMSIFGGPEGQFKEVQFGVPHNINASANLSLPLYDPQLYGGIAATNQARQIGQLQVRRTAEQVYFQVSELFYNAVILQQHIAFIDSNLVNVKKLVENVQLLHSEKMTTGTDVTRTQLQMAQLETDRQKLAAQLKNVLNMLKLNMGIAKDRALTIDHRADGGLQTEAEARTTVDMQLSTVRTQLLKTELSTLKRSRIPSLAAFASYGTTGFGFDEEPNDFLDFYPVALAGVKLQVPLFNGTVTTRKINRKKLELENSVLQTELIAEKTAIEMTNALESKLSSERSTNNYLAQSKLADEVYRQTLLQQQEGLAGLTEVLLAENELRKVQQEYLNALITYLKADLELKKVSGNITIKEP